MAEEIGLRGVLDLGNFDAGIGKYLSGVNKMNTETGRAAGSLATGWDNMGKSVLSATALMGKALVGATLAATAAVAAFTVGGIKGAADLEEQLSSVAAVLGKTTAEVGPLKEAVYALALNPNLKVSVDEAAKAMELLARNGLTMQQILGGAAEATVLLANATKADFGVAADIATDAMAVFNIEATDMMSAVDGIVSVTNNSKFSIVDYGHALAQSGAAAAAAGVEFEDYNTVLAATASNFGKGGDAGTSFKTFVTTLIPKSKEAAAAMQELGLMTADGANQFFDASGNLKDMNEIAILLQGALAGLSEEQRNNALSTLFGADASRTALGLMDSGKVIYTDLATASRELGISQDILNGYIEGGITSFEAIQAKMSQTDALQNAKTSTDNFNSAMSALMDILDAIGRQVGDLFLPVLTSMARSMADMASKSAPAIVAAFEDIIAVVQAFASGAPGDFPWEDILPPSLVPLAYSISEVFEGIVTVIGDMRAGVFGVDYPWEDVFPPTIATIAYALSKAIYFVADNFNAFAGAIAGVAAVFAAAGLQAALVAIATAIAAINLPLLAVIAAAALLGAAWGGNWFGIRDITLEVVAVIGDAIGKLVGWFQEHGDAIKAAWDATGKALRATADFIVAGIKAAFGEDTNWKEQGSAIMIKIQDGLESAKNGLQTAVKNVATFITDTFNDVDWRAVGETILTLVRDGIVLYTNTLLTGLTALTTSMINIFNAVDWAAVGQSIIALLKDGIEGAKALLLSGITTIVTAIGNAFNDVDWAAVGKEILTAIGRGIGAAVGGLVLTVTSAVKLVQAAWDIDWETVGKGILDGIKTGLEFAKEIFLSYFGGVVEDAGAKWTDVDWVSLGSLIISAIGAGVQAVASGFLEGFNAIAEDSLGKFEDIDWIGLGTDIIDWIKDGVVNAASALINAMKSIASNAWDTFRNIDWGAVGQSIISGIIAGVNASAGQLTDRMKSLATDAWNSVKNTLGISSPSKVFAEIGRNIVQGLIVGIGQETDNLKRSISGLKNIFTSAFVSGNFSSQLSQFSALVGIFDDLNGLNGGIDAATVDFLKGIKQDLDIRFNLLNLAKDLGINPGDLGDIANVPIAQIMKNLQGVINPTLEKIRTALADEQQRMAREFGLKTFTELLSNQAHQLGQIAGVVFGGFMKTASDRVNEQIIDIDKKIEHARNAYVDTNNPAALRDLSKLIEQRLGLVEEMQGLADAERSSFFKPNPAYEAALKQQLALIEEAKSLGVSLGSIQILSADFSNNDLVALGMLEKLVSNKRIDKLKTDIADVLDAQQRMIRETSLQPFLEKLKNQALQLGKIAGAAFSGFIGTASKRIDDQLIAIDKKIESARSTYIDTDNSAAQSEITQLIEQRAGLVQEMQRLANIDHITFLKSDPAYESVLKQQLALVEEAKALGASLGSIKILGPDFTNDDLVALGLFERIVSNRRIDKLKTDIADALNTQFLKPDPAYESTLKQQLALIEEAKSLGLSLNSMQLLGTNPSNSDLMALSMLEQLVSNKRVEQLKNKITNALDTQKQIFERQFIANLANQAQQLGQIAGVAFGGFMDIASKRIDDQLTAIDKQIERARDAYTSTNSIASQRELTKLIEQRAGLVQEMQRLANIERYSFLKPNPAYEAALKQQLALIEEAKSLGISLGSIKILGPDFTNDDLIALGMFEKLLDSRRIHKLSIDIANALDTQKEALEKQNQARQQAFEKQLDNLRTLQSDLSGVQSAFGKRYADDVLGPILAKLEDANLLESQRATLITQYRKEAEKIAALQQQENQLDFLNQQLALLQQVKDNELDASKIFGGLTLGINTSVSELLAVTQRVMQAMIAKVQGELQIASPSRVFMKIGQQTIDGLRMGVQKAMQQPLMAGVSHAPVSTRTLNFAMGGVNINNGMDEILFESRVQRIIERSLS